MRKARLAGCFSLLLILGSCSSMPPVGVLRYMAKCCTEEKCLGEGMLYLTAAEARAHAALHQREHPTHVTKVWSTQVERWDGRR